MGILNGLFGKKNNSNVRLITAVKKLDRGEDGVFARIQNDLGTYIAEVGETEDNLRKMAYAYARRASAAGLYLQGVWGREDYAYAFTMFKKFQLVTQQSINFQNEAAHQAAELLKSYNTRLSLNLISHMIGVVESGDLLNQNMVFTDDFVLDLMEKTIANVATQQTKPTR